jgi:ABC-type arginine transport system ATPase subunit
MLKTIFMAPIVTSRSRRAKVAEAKKLREDIVILLFGKQNKAAKPQNDEQIVNRIAELTRSETPKNNMSAEKIARWALDNIS